MTPLTLAEKIIAAHVSDPPDGVRPGQIVVASVDLAIAQDGTGPLAIEQIRQLDAGRLGVPRAVFFIDHAAPAPRAELADAHAVIREFCEQCGATLSDVEMGVCHQRVAESFARPGDLIIGADSHTCTAGALGAFATGMGSTDVAVGMVSGSTWLRVPETWRVEVTGELGPLVMAKDLMLTLIADIGADGATYKALEFGGSCVDGLPMNERLTLANMAVEAGAKAGLVASDDHTRAYLARQAREADWRPLAPDAGAQYERTLRYDASVVVPMVAAPHTVDNGLPAGQVSGVRVQQVLIGTCTNGRLEDLRAAAGLLRGRRRARHTRLIVTPASRAIYKAALGEGLLDVFVDAGAVVTGPGCGACVGVHAGVLAAGEVCVEHRQPQLQGPHGQSPGVHLSRVAGHCRRRRRGRRDRRSPRPELVPMLPTTTSSHCHTIALRRPTPPAPEEESS